jgi:predicted amidohydrolase
MGVDWVVFPELFVTGYLPELWTRRPSPSEELEWLAHIERVARAEGVWVVCGHPSYRVQTLNAEMQGNGTDGPLYNAASIVSPDGVIGIYAKIHLYGKEPETFAGGDVVPVWPTPWGKVAIQICFDLEFPEAARLAALSGADLLICPSNNMHPYGEFHRVFATARAMENNLFVAYCNRIGSELDLEFCGGSGVVDPFGRWLVEAREDDGLFVAELDLGLRSKLSPSMIYHRHRRPGLYRSIVEESVEEL